jgi:hypothetical protein
MTLPRTLAILTVFIALTNAAQEPSKVEGTFILGGADAKLRHVRAIRAALDEKGKPGYAVLLSAQPATDDIRLWQTAEPAKRGSFIFLMLEPRGEVWVAELGHDKAKSGRFGVVTEVKVTGFEAKGNHLTAHLRTDGEQEFSGDHYSIDLQFDVALEDKK